MSIISTLTALFARLRSREVPDSHDVDRNQAWSISARLAGVPDIYRKIVPQDLAELVGEAKNLHPEMAEGAKRREQAIQTWIESAAPAKNTSQAGLSYMARRREELVQSSSQVEGPSQNDDNRSWVAHAYPLQQVTIRLQGTRHSDRAAVIEQLVVVLARLRAGDTNGEVHDDDFGYRFEVDIASQGPSFFDTPSAKN